MVSERDDGPVRAIDGDEQAPEAPPTVDAPAGPATYDPRRAFLLATVLVLAGFLLMALAWNGAAGKDFIQGQFPYLLSGGLPGLGLVVAGAAVALAQARRADTMLLAHKLDLVLEALEEGRFSGVAGPLVQAVPDDAVAVVHGRRTFHRPSCRLVGGRTDAGLLPRADATERGLEPCRVCQPASTTRVRARAANGQPR